MYAPWPAQIMPYKAAPISKNTPLRELARSIARVRMSCHNLMIERGRIGRLMIPRPAIVYPHCVWKVENAFYVLSECPLFVVEREEYLKE